MHQCLVRIWQELKCSLSPSDTLSGIPLLCHLPSSRPPYHRGGEARRHELSRGPLRLLWVAAEITLGSEVVECQCLALIGVQLTGPRDRPLTAGVRGQHSAPVLSILTGNLSSRFSYQKCWVFSLFAFQCVCSDLFMTELGLSQQLSRLDLTDVKMRNTDLALNRWQIWRFNKL